MAPPPRGVLFGPIVDWSKGSSKVLLEFIDDGGIRRMRQYVLEEVTKWHLVPGFGENGSRALSQSCANTEKCKSECSVNGRLEGFDFTYEQAEAEDNVLESITVRPMRPNGSVLDGMTHRWTLSTPRPARRGLQGTGAKDLAGTVAQDLAGVEAGMEEFQEEAESKSEDKRRRKRNTRLGKKPRLGEYGGGLEPAKARSFKEVVRSFGEGKEDTTMEDIPSTATRMKKNQGLKDSRHAVIDLTEEEVDRMAEEVIEGQGQDRGKEKTGGDKEDVMEN
ncbi:hypothetical protein BGX38DRAFT_1300721 [Terfezia claveryi]|nr:hypothetical protein BGX38DRAFT_1300721 [Terfezia claveryi]